MKNYFKPTFTEKEIKCGRPECKMCPHPGYWYMYFWDGTKLRCIYIGKKFILPMLLKINDRWIKFKGGNK